VTVELFATRVIQRPADEVAEFFFDATNNPLWQKGMRRCEWTSPGPITVGSAYVQEASFMGRTISSRFEVTEHDPGRSITIRTIESTFPIEVTRTVDPIDDSACRVTVRISGGPEGALRLLSPITRWMAQRSVDADYTRLVTLLT
jgi:hypothetical protein